MVRKFFKIKISSKINFYMKNRVKNLISVSFLSEFHGNSFKTKIR